MISRRGVSARRGWRLLLVLAATGLIFVLVWFQPQRLLVDQRANEGIPTVSGDDVAGGRASSGSKPAFDVVRSGHFRGLEHDTEGGASLLRLRDGSVFLRLEDLETSNGPDLRVYLSEIPAGDDWFVYGERFVDLGALKANLGDQNYAVPAEVDLSRYRSAVIWCRRFAVGFGVASLGSIES